MLKLGIVGTNWITEQFVAAAHESGEFQLTEVYSRREASATEFAQKFDVTKINTDLADFMASPDFEVVYIASPNSLHYSQAKQALGNGKHVIVEKPAVTTGAEINELIDLANAQNRFYFEAARNIHETSFKKLAEILPPKEKIIGANFSFMKYSSRYDLVLAGEEPNIFSPKFAGGALMDLGVYVVYGALALFGKPVSAHYFAQKIATGVDGIGTMIFRYENFDVNLMTGKIGNSFLPSEIYTLEETYRMNALNSIDSIKIFDAKTQTTTDVPCAVEANPMIEEARDFAAVINNPTDAALQADYTGWLELARDVHTLMEELRQQAGIKFTGEN